MKAYKKKGSRLQEFEVELYCLGDAPNELGFAPNPPIVVHAKSKRAAVAQLKLPKDVWIQSIKRTG